MKVRLTFDVLPELRPSKVIAEIAARFAVNADVKSQLWAKNEADEAELGRILQSAGGHYVSDGEAP